MSYRVTRKVNGEEIIFSCHSPMDAIRIQHMPEEALTQLLYGRMILTSPN